jgi:proline utilization trans-activator
MNFGLSALPQALYSNQLNRRKTAYMYSGMSARLCNVLQMHQTVKSTDCSPMEHEHRKRVWWSTFCLDRMTSTNAGLPVLLQVEQADLAYPTDAEVPIGDSGEFSDANYLTARVQLTMIEEHNLQSAPRIGHDDVHNINIIIRPQLQRLLAWKEGLPGYMASELETAGAIDDSVGSLAASRALANLHLRYNQASIHCTYDDKDAEASSTNTTI